MIPLTDLHTHILPGVDDGAPDVKTAVQLLLMEAEQGVTTVALTPHFYRSREHISDFLNRRASAMESLQNVLQNIKHPRLILSAEVAYMPGMAEWPELNQLCYAGGSLLLVEPPVTPWNDEMFRQLYAIEGRRGITPMIAHLDRYFGIQTKEHIAQLVEMGFPVQISTDALLHMRGRRRALEFLASYNAVPVTDCHNTDFRPPNWDAAVRVLERKCGDAAHAILRTPANILLG